MDNVFNKAAGAGSNRKFTDHAKVARFSPSFGVHQGFIKDPNWPPARFPEEGNAANRRFRRLPASFQVAMDGAMPVDVTGNISSGGAMFVMPQVLQSPVVEVRFGNQTAIAEVIASESKNGQFIYRAKFVDDTEAASVWTALVKATH